MSESKHTPGPWKIQTPRTRTIIKSGPNIVGILESGVRQADARLISQAPLLPEFAEFIKRVSEFDGWEAPDRRELRNDARALLAQYKEEL